MDTSFDLSNRDSGMKVFEDLTTNAKQIQDNILEEILTSNITTEYLRRFLDGRPDKQLFKKNVPVVTYEDVQPYIERMASGELSGVISSQPVTCFLRSSGTSGGALKKFPINNKYLDNVRFIYDLRMLVISKHVDGVEQGKGMMFLFSNPDWKTSCGMPLKVPTSCYLNSNHFKNRPLNWYYAYTSPDEVMLCVDRKQSLYCHLLCGLVQRDDVARVGAIFASLLVRAIKFLDDFWKELCSNIRSGILSEWITDLGCRNSVSLILKGPHPELADMVELECSQKSWKGIITRLWPKTKYIETIVTGSMAQYIPSLEFYCNGLPLISTTYASAEAYFGINLDPLCKPEEVSYTFMPNMSYFEFLNVEGNNNEIVDLVDVKLGCSYELVVTNFSGLYRIRVGDILLVTGFHNNTPQFRFIGRKNVVLSIDVEKTTEEDLLKGVNQAKCIIDASDLMLIDFTSCTDTSTIPGHYVLYWELVAKNKDDILKLDHEILTKCCFTMEESFNVLYRSCRSKVGSIGALEIKVVQPGTFDFLMDFFVAQGTSVGQYKTPRCIKSAKALEVLEKRVIGRFFSEKCPS